MTAKNQVTVIPSFVEIVNDKKQPDSRGVPVENIVTADSPVRSRISDIKKKFKTRQPLTRMTAPQNPHDPQDRATVTVTANKRKPGQ